MHTMHLAGIDLNLLVALEVLLTERHVTRAAHRIGLSQSAMSHALARLRELLSDPILVRSASGLTPTPRAAALHEPLRRALEELQGALREQTPFDAKHAERTFTLATTDYGAFVMLPALAARLAKEAPRVTLNVRNVDDVAAGLEDGSAEIALAPVHSLEPRSTLRKKDLFDERFVCAVREGHPLGSRKLTLARWVALDHLLIAPRGRAGSIVDTALEKHGLRRRTAVAVPHFLVAPLVIAETDLVVTLAERVARRFERTVPLRIMKPPVDLPGFTTACIWHPRYDRDPAHAWLRAQLEDIARSV